MTVEQARRRIVLLSLATTTGYAGFLIMCPLFLQLDSVGAYRLVQIILPVFAGYLGSATLFLFQSAAGEITIGDPVILRYIVYGAFGVFWFLGICLFSYFYLSNLPGGVVGMNLNELANYLTLLVAFMNVTVGALSTFLFRVDPNSITKSVADAGAGISGSEKASS